MKDEERLKREHERSKIWGPKEKSFEEEIRQDPFIHPLSEKYRPTSIGIWTSLVAKKKVEAAIFGPEMVEQHDQEKLKHVEFASKVLEQLLQKKLFNMQLLWRANRLRIPEIKISDDFTIYGRYITECPFLENITDQEVAILRQYMQSFNFEMDDYGIGLTFEGQDYAFLLEQDEGGHRHNMPEFYEFYDGLMGTFYLLDLPDERGPLEKKYMSARRNKWKASQSEKQKEEMANPTPNAPGKPAFFPFNKALTNRIFKETEPPEFMEYKRLFDQANTDPKRGDEFEIKLWISNLEDITDAAITLPSYLSWDEALQKALLNYKAEKASEVLDLAVEQYQMKAQLGLFDTKAIEEELADSLYRRGILEGRLASGEPEDFEF